MSKLFQIILSYLLALSGVGLNLSGNTLVNFQNFNPITNTGSIEISELNSSSSPDDYWVYIRTYDKPELTVGGAGRSKKGDIVQILPSVVTNDKGEKFNLTPSEIEKKEWLIVRVSGLTKEQIELMMEPWQEETGMRDGQPVYETKAYRRYKINLDDLKLREEITISTGLWENKLNQEEITSQLKPKDQNDITSYYWQSVGYAFSQTAKKLAGFAGRLIGLNIEYAKAANTTHTVITTGGGDYLTLNAYEDAIDGTAYGAGETATVNCSGTTADTTAVSFAGWDADVTIYVNGDYATTSGVHWSTSYYRLDCGGITAALITDVSFIYLTKIQIQSSTRAAINIPNSTYSAGATITMQRVIATATSGGRIVLDGGDDAVAIVADNCAFYSNNVYRVTQFFYNATFRNCIFMNPGGPGVRNYGGTCTLTNCVVFNTTDDFTGTIACNYCASDDADASTYTNGINWNNEATDWAANFIDYANFDFHLKSTAPNLINAGTDLFGSGVTTDIDGDTLTARNDIGVDEYVAAGGGATSTPSVQIKGGVNIKGGVRIK